MRGEKFELTPEEVQTIMWALYSNEYPTYEVQSAELHDKLTNYGLSRLTAEYKITGVVWNNEGDDAS